MKHSKMTLRQLAVEIIRNWKNIYFGARPYIAAMMELNSVDDMYGVEDGRTIVMYFLSNASTWRGPEARAIKAELKKRIE